MIVYDKRLHKRHGISSVDIISTLDENNLHTAKHAQERKEIQ